MNDAALNRPLRSWQFVLKKLPGPTLRTALRDTQRLTATTVSGGRGAGHLMIQTIRTLASDIGSLAPQSAAAVVADSVSQILIAGLATPPTATQVSVSHLTTYHREQIKSLVRSRLAELAASPTLTLLEVVCRHVKPRPADALRDRCR